MKYSSSNDLVNINAFLPNISPTRINFSSQRNRIKLKTTPAQIKMTLTTSNDPSPSNILKKTHRSKQVSQYSPSKADNLPNTIRAMQSQIDDLTRHNTELQGQLNNLTEITQNSEQLQLSHQTLLDRITTLEEQLHQLHQQQQPPPQQQSPIEPNLRDVVTALENRIILQQNQLINSQEVYERERNKLKAQVVSMQQQSTQKMMIDITEQVEVMKTSKLELQRILVCKYCNKQLKKSVTVIPCGHSYCFDCKKGYQVSCYICGPQKEIEAVYLNLFMDEILKVYKHFQDTQLLLEKLL